MRRPLDWFVVSLSLLVLWANRVWEEPTSLAHAPAEEIGSGQADPGLFAYVSEDGEEFPVPIPGNGGARPAVAADRDAPEAAVYTWSTPVKGVISASQARR